MKKFKDLMIILAIYILAYLVGLVSCFWIENIILKMLMFDFVATVVTYIFSCILKNSSVYDAYWSVTPMVISIWLFIECGSFSIFNIIFLVVFNIWSIRLTINWITVFTDFTYEDWRYKHYREVANGNSFIWFILNFFGIHLMPTLFVFAGMLPLFVISDLELGWLSLIGDAVILLGVSFEFFADKNMHSFLKATKEKVTCRYGLWKYSRHPNYLGEITVWFGVFVVMLTATVSKWYFGAGFLIIFLMFNVISIPLMENRQLSRRPDYVQYRKETSRLFILPNKK